MGQEPMPTGDAQGDLPLGRGTWPDPVRELLSAAIIAFGRRPDGWNGDGGRAPDEHAIADALAFVEVLAASGISWVPVVLAPGDGEVTFQWRPQGGLVEVGFLGDGTISWSARVAGLPAAHADEPLVRSHPALPDALAAALAHGLVDGAQ